MKASVNIEQVAAMAALLPRADKLRLVEQMVHDLAEPSEDEQAIPCADWMSLRGIAPNLLVGEDVQAWVSRTRQEADENRNPSIKRKP